MAADLAVRTWKEEDMRHADDVWKDPAYAREPLRRLRDEYKRHISSGPTRLAGKTVRKYVQDLDAFIDCLVGQGLDPVLGSVTPDAVTRWTEGQEARGNGEATVAGRVISLKTFTHKFILGHLELTTVDLLRKVPRPELPLLVKDVLTEDEREQLLESYERETFEDIRDRAIMAAFMATGLRFTAVRLLPLSSYDRISGTFKVTEKGEVEREAALSQRARKWMNEYLARRPKRAATDQMWVTQYGTGLSEDGLRMVFRRAKERSGIDRLHAHLLRHGMGQHAAEQGLAVGEIQTLLGHKTQTMARRYAGKALDRQGARLMVQFSPIG
jgi:site-specific recombinase XerD